MKRKYSIHEMEVSLKNATSNVLGEIKGEFLNYLSELQKSGLTFEALAANSQVVAYRLSDHKSLNEIYSSAGFYVICTDHDVSGNICTFSLGSDQTAIYRGECSSVKRRIESHIFNSTYQKLYEERKKSKLSKKEKFSEPYYGACMKVDPTLSGINIDESPYVQSKWHVVVLKMPKSSSQVRRQAELAFDALFGKPIASREQ